MISFDAGIGESYRGVHEIEGEKKSVKINFLADYGVFERLYECT